MKSMTGYGRASGQCEKRTLVVEISSVNRKNLDCQINSPRNWLSGEAEIAGWLKERVARGSVVCALQWAGEEAALPVSLNGEQLRKVVRAYRKVAEEAGIAFVPDANWLLQVSQMLGATEMVPPWTEVVGEVKMVVTEALEHFVASREMEGVKLGEDLRQRLERLQENRRAIEAAASENVPRYREMLLLRLRKADLEWDMEDERVLREVAVFADRCDISEELTRLASHLELLGEYLTSKEEPIGRKADFLLQEINRELNTIGTKANNLSISRQVLEAKNESERIREQIQNIE